MMLPVDMRAVPGDFEDVTSMIEKMGTEGAAEAFVKARQMFLDNPDQDGDDERPQPMTAAEWREVLESNEDIFGDEDLEEEDGLLDEGDFLEDEDEEAEAEFNEDVDDEEDELEG